MNSPGFVKVRKCKPGEMFHEIAQRDFNFMITCYWMKIKSTRSLDEHIMKKCLSLLFKNFDALSLCVREEDGECWFCRMQEEKLDFEALDLIPPAKVLDMLTSQNFDSANGPLWRVRSVAEITDENILEKCEDFERVTNILISFHHAITDGSTSFKVCNSFLQILNDVLNGSETEVYENFGKFSDGVETEQLIINRKEFLEKNPEMFERIKTDMSNIANQTEKLTNFYPVSPNEPKCTKHITKVLNLEDTTRLINKFKSENISFHAGFTAIANWVIMELLQENGVSQETIDIAAFHTVNMRRYWKTSNNKTSFPQGLQFGSLRMLVKTPNNVGETFWSYAKDVNKQLRDYLKDIRSIDEVIAYQLVSSSGSGDMAEVFRNPPPTQFYYSTTNMGDATTLLPAGDGNQAKLEWLTRSTSCHHLNITFINIFQTYNGRLLHGLDYNTTYVRDDLAKKYEDKIFQKLNEIARL